MATNFPTSLDNLTNPAGSDPVNNPSHASQHANLNDAIEKLEEKVGVNNSAVTTSLDYRVKQLETNPTYTNEEAVDAVALALAAGTHSNITINYNDTGNSISISAAAGYTDEEARDAVALALRGSGGITISSDDTANTITISVDSTIATKTYVDTAVSNLGSTAASTYVPVSEVGNADGIATLDANARIPLSQLGNLIDGAPAALDTLNELAAAINDDASYAAGITTALGLKAPIASPTFTGDVVLPSTTTYNGTNIQTSLDSKGSKIKSVSTKTADYTLTTSDVDSIIEFNSSSDLNLTLPTYSAAPFTYGSSFSIANHGTGKVNVLNQSGTLPLSSYSASGAGSGAPYNILFGNNLWLGHFSTSYYRSTDGVTWTNLSQSSSGGSSPSIAPRANFANGVFILGGTTLRRSTDLVTITTVLSTGDTWSAPTYFNGTWLATGSAAKIARSTDNGLTWTVYSSVAGLASVNFLALQYIESSSTWYAFAAASASSVIKSIDDGITWTVVTTSNYVGADLGQVSSIGSTLITTGVASNNSRTSTDGGATWVSRSSAFRFNKILKDGTTLITVGYVSGTGLVIYTSVNGITWVQQSSISYSASPSFVSLAKHNNGQIIIASGAGVATSTFYSTGTVTTSYISKNNGSYIPSKGRAEIYNYNQNQFVVSGNIDSVPYLETQYGGTGTVTSPSSGQVLYSASGSTYAPATLSDLVTGAKYQTTAPSSPAVGQIWIDSDEDVTTFDSNIIRRKAITATAGQTVFTADLPFIDGFEQIFMNGLLLVKTTDYATSGGNTVTLTSGAAASDIIEIVSVTGANSVDTYTQAETNALLAANTSVAPLSISANTNLVAKKRYFVTSASALTLTLPASPALNDEIQILDASGNSSTYNITVARNANKINGGNNNLIIDTNGGWYTLLYTGSTYGWKVG